MRVVLDSWAILRLLEDDGRAASKVSSLLAKERPVVSWINLGEVFYVLHRRVGEEDAMRTVRDLEGVVIPDVPLQGRILQAARVKAAFRLAYADAFAAATALAYDAPLWTGGPELLVEGAPWRWVDLRS